MYNFRLQMLMVNLNNVKYVNYEIKLNIKIFDDQDCLLKYIFYQSIFIKVIFIKAMKKLWMMNLNFSMF